MRKEHEREAREKLLFLKTSGLGGRVERKSYSFPKASGLPPGGGNVRKESVVSPQ